MKKVLSFVLLFAMVISVYGQKLNMIEKKSKIVSKKIIVDNGSSTGVVAPYADPKDTEVITLTQSGNIWSAIEEAANQVDYNARLNTVIHGHRSYGADGTGHLYLDYSTDGGLTWTTDIDIASDASGLVRYPQVAIIDDGTNAKIASAAWKVGAPYRLMVGLADMDGANATSNFDAFPSTAWDYGVPAALCSDASGSMFHLCVAASVGGFKTDTLFLVNGDISSGTPVMSQALINMDITNAPVSGTTTVDFILNKDLAFSKTTPGLGYAAVTAYDDGNQLPDNVHAGLHVWKTTDFGATWDRLPTFDWMSLPALADSIEAAEGEIKRPSFSSISLGVDANDKLHVFTQINSGPETSFNWFGIQEEAPFLNHYFDLITEDGTTWEAVYVAPLIGDDYELHTDENDYQTSYMEVSFSQDRTKVFYVWSETLGDVENVEPDVMTVAYDLNTSDITEKKQLTAGTDAETVAYLAFTSSNAIEGGADYDYQLPIVYCQPGDTDLDPINYYYLSGAGVNDADFTVGVNDIKTSNIEVYPNPASNIITISNVDDAEITVINIYGAVVLRTNMHNIDVSNFANGAYFININNGTSVVTEKVIILK